MNNRRPTRDHPQPKHSPPTFDFDWGSEQRTLHPRLFLFYPHLAARSASHLQVQVESGQVWKAIPRDTQVALYDEHESRWCPGNIVNGEWRENREALGPFSNKLYLRGGPSPTIDDNHLRPFIVLGERYSSHKQDASWPPLLAFGHAVVAPGFSAPSDIQGELSVAYSDPELQAFGHYQLWQCWGIKTTVGSELISPLTDLKQCSPRIPDQLAPGETLHGAAKRLLAEVLGLRSPRRPWSSVQPKHPTHFTRGEVVRVRFNLQEAALPCVVISSDDFNRQEQDAVVVLRCVRYRPGDEDKALLVPLGPKGRCPGLIGGWSASLAQVRGITRARSLRRVRRFQQPVKVPLSAFELMLHDLERLYG